jgi:murein DD-endopeptidase MepM/ murein hydrolase activator NlpD
MLGRIEDAQPGLTPVRSRVTVTAALAAAVLAACSGDLARVLDPATPREQHLESLRGAGLAGTALFRRWDEAGERAVGAAPLLETPFEETGYLAPERPDARGFRFAVRRGQRIVASFSLEGADAGPLFADLYQAQDSAPPRRIESADSGAATLETEIRRDGVVVLRLQPALLAGGRYRVRVHLSPALGFPVGGAAQDAIRSRFGAERDAGRRSHEGIDIFAPRGTPVLAAARGVATWVGENRLGGTVIMIRDELRREGHYYAHLDTQLVREGEPVERGDTIGLVGNTGNARTTPPHLHFGIYQRGAVDPWPYVAAPDSVPEPVQVVPDPFGGWIRAGRRGAPLAPAPGADPVRALEPRTVARALGGHAAWYRVRLPDGTEGYLPAARTEALGSLGRVPPAAVLREVPDSAGVVVASPGAGERAEVVGRFGAFDLVQLDGGTTAWLVR